MRQGLKTEVMKIRVFSFGFKYGAPLEVDLLVDVRFLPNPYYIAKLRDLNGRDKLVVRFVKKWSTTKGFLEKYFSLLEYLIPLYEKEGRSSLTIAVGCTGGRHRSVVIAEEIFLHLKDFFSEITLIHRDMELTFAESEKDIKNES